VKRGSKYWPLHQHLDSLYPADVTLTFVEIEALLEESLPKTARKSRAWWSNRTSGALQSLAWMKARYHVDEIDLTQEVVTFRKPVPNYQIKRKGDIVQWNGNLVKALRFYLEFSQKELAQEMAVRQQTISDWEMGAYIPKPSMCKLLTMVAEQKGFFNIVKSED